MESWRKQTIEYAQPQDVSVAALHSAFLLFAKQVKSHNEWQEEHPYTNPPQDFSSVVEQIFSSDPIISELGIHDPVRLVNALCSDKWPQLTGLSRSYWTQFVEALLLNTGAARRLFKLDAPLVFELLTKLVHATNILADSDISLPILEVLRPELIHRPSEFTEAYRHSSPEAAIAGAAILRKLLHDSDNTSFHKLATIESDWMREKNKPVLAELLLRNAEEDDDLEEPQENTDDVLRTFSPINPDVSGYDLRIIARDALGGYDINGGLASIGKIPPDTSPRETGILSSEIHKLRDRIALSKIKRRTEDELAIEDYDDFIAPHLSDSERSEFDALWSAPHSETQLLKLLKELEQRQGYTPVLFHELQKNSRPSERFHLQQIHQRSVRKALEQDIGCSLVHLRLREQTQLLCFLGRAEKPMYKNVCTVLQTYGINAARTFLALEQNPKHGEQLLRLVQQTPPEIVEQVFETFARIADKVYLSSEDLAKELYKSGEHAINTEEIQKELIRRGANILLDAEASINADPTGATLLKALEKYEADTILFTSLFKSAFKGKETDFSELRDLETELLPLSELTDQDRDRMRQLLDREWSKKPLEYLFPEEGSFRFFLLRRRGTIVGFIRFEDRSKGRAHANFLCVDHSLRGSGIGENIVREAIERASRTAALQAEFDASIPAGSMYVERFGFVGTGTIGEDRPDGYVEWITIERDNDLLARLSSRRASVEEIRLWSRHKAPTPLHIITFTGAPNTMELGMISAMHEAKRRDPRYVLSRYLLTSLPDGREERLLVFDIPTPAPATLPSATKTQTSADASRRWMPPESPAPRRDHYAT